MSNPDSSGNLPKPNGISMEGTTAFTVAVPLSKTQMKKAKKKAEKAEKREQARAREKAAAATGQDPEAASLL